jgi:hypothetical protein
MEKAKTGTSGTLFMPFIFLLPVGGLFGQSVTSGDSTVFDHTHQFLWFKGYWNPKNGKQFIIYKDSSVTAGVGLQGGSIIIEPDRGVHLNTTGIDEWNKKIDASLKIIDDWENTLDHPVSVDLASYDLGQLLLPVVQKDKQEYTNYKIDPQTDILNPDKEKQAINIMTGKVAEYCQEVKPKYDAIITYWKAHKGDKDGDLSIPPPPEFEYNCYACDSNLRKVYDTTIVHYVRDFFHPEDNLLYDGGEIIRSFAYLGIGPASVDGGVTKLGVNDASTPIRDLFNTNKKDPSKSGPCSYLDLYLLEEALKDIANHEYRRSMELIRRYKKDFRAAEAIIRTSLAGVRQEMLVSCNGDISNYAFEELASLVAMNIDFYMNKLRQHDWKQLANVPYIMGLIRQKELLEQNSDNATFKDLCSILSTILNGFHLSIDMDIKIGKDGGYNLCHLKGESKIAIDFVQQENQCYRWVLAEDDPKEIFKGLKMPVKKQLQSIEVNLLANQIIGPSPLLPVYAGTHKYYALLRNLKMDFCNPDQDSILISTFVPFPNAMAGIWNIPHSKPAPLGINGVDHFFQDEEKMKEQAASGEAREGADEMKKQGEELQEKMKTLASQMGNGKNKDNLDKYIQLMKAATQSQDLSNNKKINTISSLVFPLTVQNNKILADKRYDAKQINPGKADIIVYGYYTIHIEYKSGQ